MPSGCHHLTHEERCQIYALRKSGLSDPAIARQIGRDRTTVWREIRRNGGGRGYRHRQAQGKASARRSAASSVARKMTRERWRTVEDRLAEGWSPDRTAGRFRKEGIPMAGREWIYQHVRADRKAGGRLYLFLRRRGKKPNWKGGRHSGRGRIPNRMDISERPEIVEAKERIGGREADTIIGKGHSGALVSLVDRASNCTLLQRVGRRTAAAVGAALLEMLLPLAALVRTITADNGKEFAGHALVAKALGAGFLFATPYHSWERGLNEHTNGLVRGCFSKDTDSGRSQTRRRGRPGPAERASEEASMFRVKAGFGVFRRFPGIPVRVFHTLSTVLSASGRPSGQAGTRRSQGRDRSIDSLRGRRTAAGRGPRGRQPAAAAVRSSRTRRSRSRAFAAATVLRIAAVTATLRRFPRAASRAWSSAIPGSSLQAAIAAMHGTSLGRLRPPATRRAPFRVPLSRAKGATPTGAAAWRLPMAPGPPVQAIRAAAAAGPMPGTGIGRSRLPASSSAPATVSAIRRSCRRTPASISERTFGTGPSGSGSPAPSKTALGCVRWSTSLSRSAGMSRSRSIAASAGAVGGLAGNAAPKAASTLAPALPVFVMSPAAFAKSRDWRGLPAGTAKPRSCSDWRSARCIRPAASMTTLSAPPPLGTPAILRKPSAPLAAA